MRPSIRRLPRALAALYAGTIVTRIGTFVVPYLTLYLATERELSLTHTGQVIAVGGLGLLFGNLVGGAAADGISRRFTLLAALAVNVTGVALLSLSLPSAATYALALGLALCGAGMYTPAANALIADVAPADVRPLAYTVNYVCINVGMGIGPLLGGVLAASSFQWLFAGDIAASLGCAALLAFGLPRERRADRLGPRSLAQEAGVVVLAGAPVGEASFARRGFDGADLLVRLRRAAQTEAGDLARTVELGLEEHAAAVHQDEGRRQRADPQSDRSSASDGVPAGEAD